MHILRRARWPETLKLKGGARMSRRMLACLLIISLALLLGGWQDFRGNTINPRYVERIKDGVTKKHEILLLFGDPEEIDRTPEGLVFYYRSYVDAPPERQKSIYKEPEEQSTTALPFYLDEEKKIQTKKPKQKGKILKSTLTVRFKADGETVLSHNYQETAGKK